ncbi:MAG: tRNA (guanosine(46)-N7)-methyltransferase TrmB [Gammaproteobacteria bacterium]|nr:MAG: tRNA (guanosine(46)-N7)-methyltransferase TrmB [Gammaproteobacteria bacterium]
MLTEERQKSFVLRRGRITSNQKNALDTLWDRYVLKEDEYVDSFLSDKHSVLDIGFGAGETTTYLAKNMPNSSILGAEVYLSGIGSTLSRSNEEKLTNIKILNSDIVPFLEEKISDCSFDLVLMFYPDPWPKRKHHKRRLFQEGFINLIQRKLRKDGLFYFKTDWNHYYEEAKKLPFEKKKWKVLDEGQLDILLQELPETSFEKKALKAKRDLNKIILQKI